ALPIWKPGGNHGLTHSGPRRGRRCHRRDNARRLKRPLVRIHARLAVTGTARRQRRRSVRVVAWRLARWLAWRLAPRMGLASRLWLGGRVGSLGLGGG